MAPHFAACEQDVSVSKLPGPAPAASLRLHDGAARLGWSSIEVPRWYRYAPDGSGDGVKQSMTKTYVPRATGAGCRLVPDTRVLRLGREDGRWTLHCVPSRTDAATRGRAFDPKTAVAFAATVSVVLLAAAAANSLLGERGLLAAAGLAGLADAHAPAISIASLVAAGKLDAAAAVTPILAALPTNTISKIVLAATAGGRRFAWAIVPGLLLVIAAAWTGAVVGR